MEERNVKLLIKILLIIILIVFIIVLLSLRKYIFRTDNYKYDVPKITSSTTTTRLIDTFWELSEKDKSKYNEKLLNKDFLLPLNNLIKEKMSTFNTNIVQSDEDVFKYIYIKLSINDNSNITWDMISKEAENTFMYSLDKNNLSKYLVNDVYKYEYDLNYSYCLKAKKIRDESNKIYINFDIISYNEESCNCNVTQYESLKEGLLSIREVNGKYYLDSIMLMKKEG